MTILSEKLTLTWPETTTGRPDAASPDQLLAACLGGEEWAYDAVYKMYGSLIYRLCYSILQDREDAEEVLQDTFEYAFRRLERYDAHKAAFKTWLYQIAISRCRNKRRRKWLPTFSLRYLPEEEATDHHAPDPDELLVLDDRQRLVWQALQQLSPKLRETAVLRYYDNLTYAEISAILNIPAKTAESRMRLAHKALRQLLNEAMANE